MSKVLVLQATTWFTEAPPSGGTRDNEVFKILSEHLQQARDSGVEEVAAIHHLQSVGEHFVKIMQSDGQVSQALGIACLHHTPATKSGHSLTVTCHMQVK